MVSSTRTVLLTAFVLAACPLSAAPPQLGTGLPGPLPLFPAYNWWNTDVSAAPVDPGSATFIAFINNGGTRKLHPDFGGDEAPGSVAIYGFPYAVVDASQPKKAVQFDYADESDGVDHTTGQSYPFYPIPDEAITQAHWVEGGDPGNVDLRSQQDRHLLIVDHDNRYLYELYNVFYDGQQWVAGSGARFDLTRSDRRPDGWTSADAAGLAILPGLVRYDEVYGAGENRARLPGDRAGDQRLRVPRVARCRLQSAGPAHGGAAPAQGQRGPVALPGRRAEDLPRHAALRPDRGRQRLGHVHQRHLRRPLGQQRPQPGLRRADGQRLRGHPARVAATRHDQPVLRRGRHQQLLQLPPGFRQSHRIGRQRAASLPQTGRHVRDAAGGGAGAQPAYARRQHGPGHDRGRVLDHRAVGRANRRRPDDVVGFERVRQPRRDVASGPVDRLVPGRRRHLHRVRLVLPDPEPGGDRRPGRRHLSSPIPGGPARPPLHGPGPQPLQPLCERCRPLAPSHRRLGHPDKREQRANRRRAGALLHHRRADLQGRHGQRGRRGARHQLVPGRRRDRLILCAVRARRQPEQHGSRRHAHVPAARRHPESRGSTTPSP